MTVETELEQLLGMMLAVALKHADRVPTPSEPADPAWERATDEFCLRFARTNEAETPSPEVASALIPRLRSAILFGGIVEAAFAAQAKAGDSAANERAILESILVTAWHDDWKAHWLAGEIE